MLDFDLVTILAEVINFLVLAVALYFLLFKPIVKRMEKRAEEKEVSLQEAKEKQAQADQRLEEIESRLANIDAEIETRLENAFQQAQKESDALLEATRKEAEKVLSDAENEAAIRQHQEVIHLQEDLVDSILELSSQVLVRTAPEIVHNNLVDELNTEIWDMGKNDMRQVRAIRETLSERTPSAFVTTAKELTPDQQRALVRTFSALADTSVNVEIEVDSNLIAGLRVRMGDLIVENNLAMELAELRSEIYASLEESLNDKE